MEEKILIQSEKIKLKKVFNICWGALAVILITILILSVTQYIHYKKGQNLAVTLTLAADIESGVNNFDKYKNNRKELIKEMYDYYTERPVSINTKYGKYDNREEIELRREMDDRLGDMLEEEGYTGHIGSYWLKYIGFISYNITNCYMRYIIFLSLFILMLIVNYIYIRLEKVMITIKEKSVIYNKTNKKSKEFLIKDIKSIESMWLHGLKIKGDSINLKIYLVKNADEIKMLLMDMLKSF